MRTRRKLSVTIEEETLRAIEGISSATRVAKSRLAQEALHLWLRKRKEELMARAYEDMAQEDSESAMLAFEAQKETRP